eukprot:TRINITY_DN43636_c0_g1_i1.p1 TRINITY_DN43636_c0_g1~~TRINITY_DN43636_c0_g1_i1.p1  ORF type:complete len:351 (+),score=50.35 TRINITY_DN43636_c0_g1_i1:70-1122(+)
MHQEGYTGYSDSNYQSDIRSDLQNSLYHSLRTSSQERRDSVRRDVHPFGSGPVSPDDGLSVWSMKTSADSKATGNDLDSLSSTSRPFSRMVTPCPMYDFGVGGGEEGFSSKTAAVNVSSAPGLDYAPTRASPAASALRGATTVMIKPLPTKYTQRKLLRELLGAGFQGKIDFIYLPLDARSQNNRGFGFCNLESTQAAERFYRVFQGSYLNDFESSRPLEVSAAEVQGFEANAELYFSSKSIKTGRNTRSHPIFLRALPPRLQQLDAQQRQQGKDTTALGVIPLPPGQVSGGQAGMATPSVLPPMPVKLMQQENCQTCNRRKPFGAAVCPRCGVEIPQENGLEYAEIIRL